MKHDIPLVFFGSGPVASQSLRLLNGHFPIEAIVTKPATAHDMQGVAPKAPILTASTRSELDNIITNRPFGSRLAVLVDFGIIVSRRVIDIFPLGIINSHFSLLPEWRGADPITFTILSGQAQTGVSLMLLSEGLDEGPLLAQAPVSVPPDITSPELTERLIELSDAMLQATIPTYAAGAVVPAPQEQASISGTAVPTYSRKLTKDDGIIDWRKPADQIDREVRAFLEWPKSRTTLAGREVIITRARPRETPGAPGQVHIEHKQLLVGCGQGSLEIERLKPAGKPEMTASAFLAGYKSLL